MKALVVDDSLTIRLVLGGMLRDLGFEVAEACHGREALDHLNRHDDTVLALVDYHMPEMNGLDLLLALRRDPRFRNLRLMMVTAETEMALVARALEAGANEYVMKPFTREAIADKLRLLGLAA